jgi:hypothetical protein
LYREFDLEFSKKHTGLISHTSSSNPTIDSLNKGDRMDSSVSFHLKEGLDKDVPDSIVPQALRVRGESKPLVGGGITHTPGHLNPFIVPVLHAPPGAFSGELGSEEEDEELDESYEREEKAGKGKWKQVVTGEEAGLVSVFQSRGNARFGWAGVGMIRDSIMTNE